MSIAGSGSIQPRPPTFLQFSVHNKVTGNRVKSSSCMQFYVWICTAEASTSEHNPEAGASILGCWHAINSQKKKEHAYWGLH